MYDKVSDYGIKCGSCGRTSRLLDFCKTPLGGDLPKDTFQCPACGFAWRVRGPKEMRTDRWGLTYYPEHPDQIEPGGRLIRVPRAL
jgi:hypothetical protein